VLCDQPFEIAALMNGREQADGVLYIPIHIAASSRILVAKDRMASCNILPVLILYLGPDVLIGSLIFWE